MRRHLHGSIVIAATLCVVLIAAAPAAAQLNTQHIKGSVGLKAGSQPPPHVYVIAPYIYVYQADSVRNRNGDEVAIDASITSVAYAGGVSVVTGRKLLGGSYGYQILAPVVANNRLQGTEIDANPGAGISDSAVVPISLGWHFNRADAVASYTIYIPTGRYTDGADDNTGFGMWGHEVGFGTTLYLNEKKQYHASSLVSFDFQSKKEDSETKVGNEMNVEGGAGADFLEGGLSAGLAYYWSGKLTDDHIEGFPDILIRGRNRVFALGPEVTLALAKGNTVYGFLKVNYEWEVYARTTTQGRAFQIVATFLVPPLRVPKP
ncbi:MAG TPA: transporter [Vicinamibacterales bacterium]|jgi:hypothetical protein